MIRRHPLSYFFFFNDTATTEIYTLSLHDALPISEYPVPHSPSGHIAARSAPAGKQTHSRDAPERPWQAARKRSEEHTSELQSRSDLVCRLLLEKKKKIRMNPNYVRYTQVRVETLY